jgi:hypothetical protein
MVQCAAEVDRRADWVTADALYRSLIAELEKRHARILSHCLDEEHFDSFAITFVVNGRERTVISDRGELAVITVRSEPFGNTLIPDLREANPVDIVDAVVGLEND